MHNYGELCGSYFFCWFSVNLSSDAEDKLKIYRENFEKAYLEATESFYKAKAPEYLVSNGVQNYMRYADAKLKEEEQRATRYLETRKGCNSVAVVSSCSNLSALCPLLHTVIMCLSSSAVQLTECCVNVLVTAFKETILAECAPMIKANETESKPQIFAL